MRGRLSISGVLLALTACVALLGCDAGSGPADAGSAPTLVDVAWDAGNPAASSGCGLAPPDAPGGVQVVRTFSAAAGGERSFFLVIPDDYDPAIAHRVVVGFAGTNWTGEMIRPYLDLERPGARTIFVYPDPLVRDFEGWGRLGGWLLGPHAAPADGMEDLDFFGELLDHLEASYCVDRNRVFATGHSWGGDMAAVVGCFRGDRVRAVAPVAANRPYWFELAAGETLRCRGRPAVWTFFGQADDHFTSQPHQGAYGEEQDAFWSGLYECGAGTLPLDDGPAGECIEHDGCTAITRFCLYDASAGHQRPSYYPAVVRDWFAWL